MSIQGRAARVHTIVALRSRIVIMLQRAPRTVEQLMEEFDAPKTTVSRALTSLMWERRVRRLWRAPATGIGKAPWYYGLAGVEYERNGGPRENAIATSRAGARAGPTLYPQLAGWGQWR